MNQVRRLCDRAVWVDGGQIRQQGSVAPVLGAYEEAMSRGDVAVDQSRGARSSHQKASFRRWQIIEPEGDSQNLLLTLGPVVIQFTVEANKPISNGRHGIALFNVDRQLMWAWEATGLDLEPGMHEFRFKFPVLPLRPGPYYWQVSLWDDIEQIDLWDCIPEMVIATEGHQHPSDEWNGILNVPCEFAALEGQSNDEVTLSNF
jgi:hypothetical protein